MAGQLPAAAGHRAAVLALNAIGDSGTMGVCAIVVSLLFLSVYILVIGIGDIGVSLLYGKNLYLCSTAIGDSKTFNDSRLTAKFSVLPARRLVRALRCPQSLRAGTFVQCEGDEKAVRQARKAAARASLQAC